MLLCRHAALQVRFLSAPDPDDPVVKSHYRLMRSFTAGDPRPLVEGEGHGPRHTHAASAGTNTHTLPLSC